MTYFERQYQLDKTLESLSYSTHKDFEVVVVDDASKEDIKLKMNYPFVVNVIKVVGKNWVNGVPAYNIGFQLALLRGADIVIIQNAECYHVGDVLSYASNITSKEYIVFSCFSIDGGVTFKEHNIYDVIRSNNHKVKHDGETGWYVHPVYRPLAYHFCSAITAENLVKINGFDERFSRGVSFEDNYLLHQIKCLGLQVKIAEKPFVVHQFHYTQPPPPDHLRLIAINNTWWKELSQKREYRAKHLITANLRQL